MAVTRSSTRSRSRYRDGTPSSRGDKISSLISPSRLTVQCRVPVFSAQTNWLRGVTAFWCSAAPKPSGVWESRAAYRR